MKKIIKTIEIFLMVLIAALLAYNIAIVKQPQTDAQPIFKEIVNQPEFNHRVVHIKGTSISIVYNNNEITAIWKNNKAFKPCPYQYHWY